MSNRKNVYTCRYCSGQTVTIDREQGVKPPMIACKATPNCLGMMNVSMSSADQDLEPDYEWYRPEITDGMSERMKSHVRLGGLDIRRIGDEAPTQT